ncbi:MAG TPA: hypothetical protein VKX25_17005 [Bryobacteraceae bacterium]|jgi:hypothetical protein|nr:hypothetical protein [Bryobacteraceae bacterium]
MSNRWIILTALVLSVLRLPAQTTVEPQYIDQFNALIAGQLVPLERENAVLDTKSRRNFVITPNTKVFESISGKASPVRLPGNAHFIVKMSTGGRDPQTLIHLKKLVVGKNTRQIPIVTYKVSLIPGGGVKHDRPNDESVPVNISKYGQESLEITSRNPLEPGEYAFLEGHDAQCFGVDAGTGPTAQPSPQVTPAPSPSMQSATAAPAPVAVSAPSQTPRTPAHPPSTLVDLPPAAPGYPALHASQPAAEGCWWVPFLADKFSLEMLVQNCEPGKWPGGSAARFVVSEHGIGVLLDTSNEPTELFTVHTKPAAQSMTAAIQQQFISKLAGASARANCKPAKEGEGASTETYTVIYKGPASKTNQADEGLADPLCPGVASDDVVSRYFLYLPQDSKTKFLFFEIQEPFPFDQASIRFGPETAR